MVITCADDLKFIAETTLKEVPHTQSSINKHENFSAFHNMPKCIDRGGKIGGRGLGNGPLQSFKLGGGG